MAKLTESEKEMLGVVLKFAGDDEKMISKGIAKALIGQNDPARRTYLWNLLKREALKRIRDARKKASLGLARAGF